MKQLDPTSPLPRPGIKLINHLRHRHPLLPQLPNKTPQFRLYPLVHVPPQYPCQLFFNSRPLFLLVLLVEEVRVHDLGHNIAMLQIDADVIFPEIGHFLPLIPQELESLTASHHYPPHLQTADLSTLLSHHLHIPPEVIPGPLDHYVQVTHHRAQVVGLDRVRVDESHDVPAVVQLVPGYGCDETSVLLCRLGQDMSD